ncbi:MAG: FtsX-like permease family protein [Bacteroidetes bacterium]|nr:FtsX-like permease family protein [Bacteroidota bacterium]
MFKNYLKVAFRNLNKNKGYAAINILGLALGLMATIIVFLFVRYETSYDKHFKDADRIYRIGIEASMMGQVIDGPIAASPAANSLRTEFDDVESASRFQTIGQEIMLRHEDNRIYIQKGVRSDSMFFTIFDYEFIHGDPLTCLTDVNSMVITEATAEKFFGEENAMGEIINFDERQDYIVTAVVREPKGLSHFQFDFWIDDNAIRPAWLSHNHLTYLKLKEGVDSEQFLQGMSDKFFTYIAPEVERFLRVSIDEFLENDNEFAYFIQPLTDIHLNSSKDYEIQQNGNKMYIYIFIAIALMVIIIAGINFMNLSTARSAKRAKEVGIRKVSGATRPMLIRQFLIESIIQSLIALFLAFIMVELFLPMFNNVMESNLMLIDSNFGMTLLFALIITIGYGLFSGSYPAFFLSAFQPVSVLKGDVSKSKKGSLLRKSLVVIQFTSSIILIVGMMIIFRQISFMHNKDLGFDPDHLLVVPLQTDKMADNFRDYKAIFTSNPNVKNVSRSMWLPADPPNQNMYEIEGREDAIPLWNMAIDYDFLETMQMEIVDGRGFNRELDHDSSATVIINESAIRNLNIENPIGARIGQNFGPGGLQYSTIVGVVKDFHIEGFNEGIKPMIMNISNYTWFATFRVNSENMGETIAFIEKEWNTLEPTHPFRYQFMDEKFGALYAQQVNFGKIFLYLTILAIIISCMGLFGLASYTAERRRKEIGIRKVLGASVLQLMAMLSKDFIKLVLVAIVIAVPISLIFARNWLSGFTYQIDLPVAPFIYAALMAVAIALVTVSYHAWHAAVSDPVKAIKYE